MDCQRVVAKDLRRLFLTLARAGAASSCIVACASEQAHVDPSAPNVADSKNWATVPCHASEGYAEPPQALRAAPGIAHVTIYEDWPFTDADGGVTRSTLATAQTTGEPCAEADDPQACALRFEQLAQGDCSGAQRCMFAVAVEAGEARRIEERTQLIAALGSIDSAAEAVLLTAFGGERLCARPGLAPVGSEVRRVQDGYELRVTLHDDCDGTPTHEHLHHIASDGTVNVSVTTLHKPTCVAGRRPPGLCVVARGTACEPSQDPAAQSRSPAADFLAAAARLEHASIFAFYQLIRELQLHNAPEELRLLALDAMLDEVRHARAVGQLARELGAEPYWAQVEQTALRSLFEIGLDNASEGCVRETFGALLATYQGECARDARVKTMMRQIAEDETRHAQLSWKLMAWLTPQLSGAEQQALEARQQEAYAELAGELDERQCEALGLPGREVAELMLAGMRRALAS